MSKSPQIHTGRPIAAGWPIVGSAPALLRAPLTFLRRQYAALGPVFDVRAPRRRFTVLAGADANRFIAVEGRDWFSSGSFWGRLAAARECPHLMLAVDGDDHKTLRTIYHDDLSRSVVDDQAREVAALTLRELTRTAGDRGIVPLRTFTRLLVSRQVHHLLTRGAPSVDARTVHAIMEVFRWDSNALLLGKWPRLARRAPTYRRYERTTRSFLDALIRDTAAAPPPGWFATTHRARTTHPALFTAGDTRMSFLLPFVAGVDTVGSTLAFALYETLADPNLRDRVTAAVDACYAAAGDRTPSIAELRAVPELHGLVLETLRLYPAAFGVYRRTTRELDFAGASVPAGTEVLVFSTATHTDARYFPRPYQFDIDRFQPPRSEHKQRFAFAPYGGGPHVCLGAGMGEALLLLGLATLLRHARLALLPSKRPIRAIFDPSLSMPDHCTVRYAGPRGAVAVMPRCVQAAGQTHDADSEIGSSR